MSIADDLQKLQTLRREGVLSDAELAQAKAAILAGSVCSHSVEDLAKQLAEVRYQIELMRIDQAWRDERRKHFVINIWRRSDVPTIMDAIAIGLSGAGFGIITLIFVFVFRFSTDLTVPFLCGTSVTFVGICAGIGFYIRSLRYARAFEAYQRRRSTIRPEQFSVS